MSQSQNRNEPDSRSQQAVHQGVSINSVMLINVVLAVCLAAASSNLLFLGTVVSALLLPSLVWTTARVWAMARRGQHVSVPQKIFRFLLSLVATIVIEVSACIAFFATCVTTMSGPIPDAQFEWIPWLLGLIAAISAGFCVYKLIMFLDRWIRDKY